MVDKKTTSKDKHTKKENSEHTKNVHTKREPLRSKYPAASHKSKREREVHYKDDDRPNSSNQTQVLIGTAIVGIIIIVLVFVFMLAMTNSSPSEELPNEINENIGTQIPLEEESITDESIDLDEILLIINGQDITAEEVAIVQFQLQQQGIQATQEQAIEQIIVNTVLIQKVEEEGITVSSEQAEEELIQMLETQGFSLEDLQQDLAAQGISYEATLEDFKERVAVNMLLEMNTDSSSIEISQEEIEEFYSLFAAQAGEDAPSLEELDNLIEEELRQQQLRELQNQFIDTLIEEAVIEYN